MEEIKTLTIEDKNYPKILKKIPNPPKILYIKGDLKLEGPTLAVVGTRRCSNYGKRVTVEIVGQLAESGFMIVSGMARGIDTLAHRTALEKNGKTIAVLGSGVDKESIYPKENIKLAEKIAQSGAVISEFPPKTPGFKSNFPKRNRIISGLSLGVLVVEGKLKSGALITARCAFAQKRKVFAVPGSIYSPNSGACHFLIKKGAKLVESAQDILKEFNVLKEIKRKEIEGETEEEKIILSTLKREALHIDQIIETTNLSPPKVMATLTILESKNKIKNLGGNVFVIVN
jgi:DNA processing protein